MDFAIWRRKKLIFLGYDDRGAEPDEPGHWYYSKNQNGRRTHKLHLCCENHPCIENQIIFRNYLRDNTVVAKKYEELKLELEKENSKGITEYLEKKGPYILNTIKDAKAQGYSV